MSSRKSMSFKNIPKEAKGTMAYAICSILQNCLGFITVPLFTRLMTTEQFGQYTIYASWSTILVIFITLNLPYGSFSRAMVKFEDKRDEYIASAEGVCILFAMLFLAIYIPFRDFWNSIFDLPTALIVLMVFEMLGNAGILFWSGKNRFEYKYKAVVAVIIFNSLVAPLLAYFLVINNEEKGYARIFGYALVTTVVGGIIFIFNLFKGKIIFSKEYWKYALGFNLPLICYYLSQVIFNQSDRIMIDYYFGKSEAAIYGVAYSVSVVLIFVLGAVNNTYIPWFYEKIKEGRKKENQPISCMISILMAVLLSAVIWLAPELVNIMGGKEYMGAIWIVPPVAVSVLLQFYSQLFLNVEFYFERKKSMIVPSIVSALINIILNAIFIPRLGYIVAGYTTLVSYFIFTVMNYNSMKIVLKEENETDDAYDKRKLVLIFFIFFVLSALAMTVYQQPVIRLSIVGIVLVVLLLNIKRIINLIQKLMGEKDEN